MIKIPTGYHIAQFSKNGEMLSICGYLGRIRIIDIKTEKNLYQMTVKGTGTGTATILHQDFSFDSQYFAFSCNRKVYVFLCEETGKYTQEELKAQGLEVKEKSVNFFKLHKIINVSDLERRFTINILFHPALPILILPQGKELHFHDLEKNTLIVLQTPEKKDYTKYLAMSHDGKYLAYQAMENKIYIYEIAKNIEKSQLINALEIPYQYFAGRGMDENVFSFIENTEKLAVFRKSEGFSVYNFMTGKEEQTISFTEIGCRTIFNLFSSKISSDGKFLFFKSENPKNQNIDEWSIGDKDLEWILYDTENKQIIWKKEGSSPQGDIDFKTQKIALLQNTWFGRTTESFLEMYEY
ncbi:MAG: WD40 repeat domain-containing protein [Raineya sp.]|jgi:WD40 repeat protein|nr:WD40 repeat domain-containing protein [Raineya sp.]